MSTIKANAVTGATTNSDLTLTGDGTGVVKLGDGNLKFPDADGSANQIIESDGAGQLSFVAKPSSTIVQVVNVTSGAAQTSTATTWVFDDTTPQNTEGTEWQTLAITPTNSSNKLLIEVVLNSMFHNQATHKIGAALFQDSNADALSSGLRVGPTAQWGGSIVFSHYMTAGTTSSTTFKVRFGTATAGTHSINTDHNSARFNGTIGSTITITEIAV